MAKKDNYNPKAVVAAAVVSSLIVIAFSAAYRVLAARLVAPVDAVALPPAALDKLPLQIGEWSGKDIPLDEAIIQATDTDAHLNRIYSRGNGTEIVSLYIAYGVRARDLLPHRPEVCYSGAGWTRTDKHSKELNLDNGIELPCNILQFSRGTLNTKKTVVLNYYIVDRHYHRDISKLRTKVWQGSGAVRYVAQVQIAASTTVSRNSSSTEKTIKAFGAESAPVIYELFEYSEKPALSQNTSRQRNPESGEKRR
jgi:EpsI family protein